MTVADSHAICDRIEATLKAEMNNLEITIHVEPEAKAKQHGVLVLRCGGVRSWAAARRGDRIGRAAPGLGAPGSLGLVS